MSSQHSGSSILTNPEHFSARLCGCGTVHLNFGHSVVNISTEIVFSITETMLNVCHELRKKPAVQDPINADQATFDPTGNIIFGQFKK